MSGRGRQVEAEGCNGIVVIDEIPPQHQLFITT